MSDPFKYGDIPWDMIYMASHEIWMRAVREFLWPPKRSCNDRNEFALSPWFAPWCGWIGHIEGAIRNFTGDPPTMEAFLATEARDNPIRTGNGALVFGTLSEMYVAAWKDQLENDTLIPGIQQAGKGMKFCLMTHVLRGGIWSGRDRKVEITIHPEGRKTDQWVREAVTWAEAREASSFLLAVSLLSRKGEIRKDLPSIPWGEEMLDKAKEKAKDLKQAVAGCRNTAPNELRGLNWREGLDGFDKRLVMTLEDGEWGKVKALASAIEKQGRRSFDDWGRRNGLDKWFIMNLANSRHRTSCG